MACKLYYFDITGLGEPIRYMLNYTNTPFEDKRISFEEWPKLKPEMPMGQMPVLEMGGKKYNQSKSICRYIGRKNNLYGKDEIEAMEIDSTADNIDDFRIPLSLWYWSEDESQKPKMKESAWQKYTATMEKLESQVKKNGGFFVGGKISWVDIYFAALCDYLDKVVGHDTCKDYPALKKIVDAVRSNANVKAYLAKRPETKI